MQCAAVTAAAAAAWISHGTAGPLGTAPPPPPPPPPPPSLPHFHLARGGVAQRSAASAESRAAGSKPDHCYVSSRAFAAKMSHAAVVVRVVVLLQFCCCRHIIAAVVIGANPLYFKLKN